MAEKDQAPKAAMVISVGAAITAAVALLQKRAQAAPPGEPVQLPKELWDLIISIGEEVQKVKIAVAQIPEGKEIMPLKIEQIPFAFNLAPLQGVTLRQPAPFSGYIKEVTIHWPAGCNALVDVRVGHGVSQFTQFCPIQGFLALNDVTPTYHFNEWVGKDENIMVEMRNTDAVNPHNITVTASMEGTP